ncbi:MAG: protein-L-isoaspartate(D-aspartate) O-methyltransferase [Planctomycetota bacterium]
MKDAAARREAMVRRQIERRGIRDPRVLEAMRRVPREAFVPPALRDQAFDDGALPIAGGQTISQPYVVALMVEAMETGPQDRVLEVGTGSGYAAAVLAEIAREVVGVERIPTLVEEARDRLACLGYEGVEVVQGDGSLGWPARAPYDAILVSAGAPDVPEALLGQLAEGGRLVLPVGASTWDQRLVRVTADGRGGWRRETLGGVRFVPLLGEQGWPADRDGEA